MKEKREIDKRGEGERERKRERVCVCERERERERWRERKQTKKEMKVVSKRGRRSIITFEKVLTIFFLGKNPHPKLNPSLCLSFPLV